jgi:hypothetical protein
MTRNDHHHSNDPWEKAPGGMRRLPARLRSRGVLTVPPATGVGGFGERAPVR